MPPNSGRNRRSRGSDRSNYLLGKSSQAGNSDTAVPVLKFGNGNNWLKFKEKMITASIEKYGDLARLMQLEKYYYPPKLEGALMAPYTDWETNKVTEMLYFSKVKARAKVIRTMADDRSKLYAYILSKLSRESMDEFKHHEEYDLVSQALSPLGLWIILKEVHSLNSTSTNCIINKREAFQQYASTKMSGFETLYDFKERFEFAYKNYQEMGNTAKDDADIALDFLYGLHTDKYSAFTAEILNDV